METPKKNIFKLLFVLHQNYSLLCVYRKQQKNSKKFKASSNLFNSPALINLNLTLVVLISPNHPPLLFTLFLLNLLCLAYPK